MKKKFVYYILLFVLFFSISIIFDLIFRKNNIDFLRYFCISFGVSFGIFLVDFFFNKKK